MANYDMGITRKDRGTYIADQLRIVGKVVTINSQSIRVLQRDADGNVLFATGTATVTNAGSGYAKGCLYIDTDIADGSPALYCNIGTTTSCNFNILEAGAAGTTLAGLTDTNVAAPAAGHILIHDGVDSFDNKAVSGDVAITSGGAVTVTDLTIAGEATGSVLYFDGTNWIHLAVGSDGDVLRVATDVPVWVDPSTLPAGIASKLSQAFSFESGVNDIACAVTTQTVGAGALTIPDFASVADTFAFVTLAQTLANKTLTSPTIATMLIDDGDAGLTVTSADQTNAAPTATIPDLGDAADEFVMKDVSQTLTSKTLTSAVLKTGVSGSAVLDEDNMATNSATQVATQQSIKAYVDSGTVTFTNKTLDCDAAGNALTNVNGNELDAVALPSAADASDAVYAVPTILMANISNQAAAVDIFTANAPFAFHVVRAWSINKSADGGTWKLNNGASGAGTDITNAVTVAASDEDFDEPTDYNDAAQQVAANGSLSIVPDGEGLLDCMVYVEIVRAA